MPGDNRLCTEYFLAQNFPTDPGITPGSENTLSLDCSQTQARYSVNIDGITSTGLRCPSQNQISAASVTKTITVIVINSSGVVGYITNQHFLTWASNPGGWYFFNAVTLTSSQPSFYNYNNTTSFSYPPNDDETVDFLVATGINSGSTIGFVPNDGSKTYYYRSTEAPTSISFSTIQANKIEVTPSEYNPFGTPYWRAQAPGPNQTLRHLYVIWYYEVPATITVTLDSLTLQNSRDMVANCTCSATGVRPILSRGIVYDMVSVPNAAQYFSIVGSGSGSYTKTITGLSWNTTWYCRAWASFESFGVNKVYSNMLTVTTPIPTIFVPDAFSPNGDGIHDTFDVFGLDYYTNHRMSIFSSAGGSLLYRSTNYYYSPWNGRIDNTGTKQPPGTYYWVLEINGSTYDNGFVFMSY